jgi:hypothetical protein
LIVYYSAGFVKSSLGFSTPVVALTGGANRFVFDSSLGSGALVTKGEVVAPDDAPVLAAKGEGFGASAATLGAKADTLDALVVGVGAASVGLGYSVGLKRELPVFATGVAVASGLAFGSAVFGGPNIPEFAEVGVGARADALVVKGLVDGAALVVFGANIPTPAGAVEV